MNNSFEFDDDLRTDCRNIRHLGCFPFTKHFRFEFLGRNSRDQMERPKSKNHVSVSFAVNIQKTQNTKAKNGEERMIREIFLQSRTDVKRRETAGNIPVTLIV